MTEQVEIFSVHESGASDSWQWVITLSRHDTVSFSLSIDQVLWDSADDGEAVGYELPVFSTGAELFDFLQSTWLNDHEEELSAEDWLQIQSNLRAVDQHLAEQVGQAFQMSTGDTELGKSSEQLQIEKCIDAATWERNTYSGGGAMWAAVTDKKKMDHAVAVFVTDHHSQHGATPQGTHVILDKEVTFPEPANAVRSKS